MLKTSFPTGDALPRPPTPRAKRKRGKVGRSYAKLGTATTRDARGVRSPGFFPTPITWGNTLVAHDIRAHGGGRISHAGKPTETVRPISGDRVYLDRAGMRDVRLHSPATGTAVEGRLQGTAAVTMGAGADPVYLDPCADPVTRFVGDGDNTARDARRKALVLAMIKAR